MIAYTITLQKIGTRYWFTISFGKMELKSGHESSPDRAINKAVEKLKTLTF